VAFIFVID